MRRGVWEVIAAGGARVRRAVDEEVDALEISEDAHVWAVVGLHALFLFVPLSAPESDYSPSSPIAMWQVSFSM